MHVRNQNPDIVQEFFGCMDRVSQCGRGVIVMLDNIFRWRKTSQTAFIYYLKNYWMPFYSVLLKLCRCRSVTLLSPHAISWLVPSSDHLSNTLQPTCFSVDSH